MKYETVLNMTTAKALGLDVPTSILLSADERNTATQEDWIADGGNGSKCEELALSIIVRFTPISDRRADIRNRQLRADFVAEVFDYSREAAASISQERFSQSALCGAVTQNQGC